MKKNIKKSKSVQNNSHDLVGLFFEMGSLRKIARAHRQGLLTDDLSDNIASHSFRVAIIGWHLARLEKADQGKVVSMCLFHDSAEARSNDHNWIHKRYIKIFEEEIVKDQFRNNPEAFALVTEYQGRKTKEAKIAKDADLIDQLLLCAEYAWAGNKEAEIWLRSKLGENKNQNGFFTESAQLIAKEISTQKPSDWWKDIWTSKNR